LLGDIRLKHQVASFSRMLSTLLQGGLPLVPINGNGGFLHEQPAHLKRCNAGRQSGSRRTRTRAQFGRAEDFSRTAVEMIEVGESTGALPAMLNSVAEFYEERCTDRAERGHGADRAAILIIMAIFVGGVLISLYLPIFTLGVH